MNGDVNKKEIMKTQDKQIIQKLQAYDPIEVLKAFELYKKDYESKDNLITEELLKEGWAPQKNEPDKGIPFYFIDNKYWVLSEKARQEKIKRITKGKKEKKVIPKPQKKTSMGLKESQMICPVCKAKMYKQNICPGCKEGKKGYRVRLICEENPDHEFLV